jgi:hypothetical protein
MEPSFKAVSGWRHGWKARDGVQRRMGSRNRDCFSRLSIVAAVALFALGAFGAPLATAKTGTAAPKLSAAAAHAAATTAATQLLVPAHTDGPISFGPEQLVSVSPCTASLVLHKHLNLRRQLFGCQEVTQRSSSFEGGPSVQETHCRRLMVSEPVKRTNSIPYYERKIPFKRGFSVVVAQISPDPAPPIPGCPG